MNLNDITNFYVSNVMVNINISGPEGLSTPSKVCHECSLHDE